MFQQHFRSQQYGIGIVIYLGLNESRSNLVMKFYVPNSKQCQYIYPGLKEPRNNLVIKFYKRNSKQCQYIYPARRRRKFEV